MPIAVSKYCVYHEIYSGPFLKDNDVRFPKWAPSNENKIELKKFFKKNN